ncbi:PaaI family thioesterase [Peribacillus simplex]|uniref:PaaI family thioesterase n=1 Tax=Peribacillus simplex TaxID=1478 RepID=UPI00367234A4
MTFKDTYESSPFWKLLGIEMDQVNPEFVRIKLSITSSFLNVNRSVHGGIIASMLDTIMGVTLRHQNYDAKVATVSLTTQFIAPVLEGTTIYGTARVVHCGRRIAALEAKLESSESGEILATGIGTFVIKR